MADVVGGVLQPGQLVLGPSVAALVGGQRHAHGRGGIGAGALGDHVGDGGQVHLFEEVQVAVAGRAVGAQRHRQALVEHVDHRREAAAQLQVAGGVVDGIDAVGLQDVQVRVGTPHAVGGGGQVEYAHGLEPGRRGQAVALDALLVLLAGLGQVQLHRGPLLPVGADPVGVVAGDGVVDGVLGVNAEVHADAAVLAAVVFVEQRQRLGHPEVFFRGLGGVEGLHHAGQVHLHANLFVQLDHGAGLHVHVAEGGDAAGQHLQHRQLVACDEDLGLHAVLQGEHGLEQPAVQREVVANAPQQRHRCVAVAVDEPGDEQPAAHVLLGVVGGRGPACADVVDGVAVDAQEALGDEVEPIVLPGQYARVFQQQLHSATSPRRSMIFAR